MDIPDSLTEPVFPTDDETLIPVENRFPDDSLEKALSRHSITTLTAPQTKDLDHYCQLLWKKNQHLNLTRHTDYEKFVTRDLIDSIHLAKLLTPGEHVLDVGTGGGVPGVLLAILRPDLKVELCDSTGKKANAVGEILEQMKLDIPIWHSRAENLLKVHRFQTLLIRAVARMKKLMEWFTPHWYAFDRLLMIKGPHWVDERGESRHFNLMSKVALRKLDSYQTPGTEAESVILQICLKQKLKELEEHGGAIPPVPLKERKSTYSSRRKFRKQGGPGFRGQQGTGNRGSGKRD